MSDVKIQFQKAIYEKNDTNICLTLVVCWKSDYMDETVTYETLRKTICNLPWETSFSI